MAKEKSQKADELTINEKLNDFIHKNRMKFFIGLVAVIAIIAGAVVTTSLRDRLQESGLVQVDAFERRFSEEMEFFAEAGESEIPARTAGISALLEDLEAFQRRAFGFASARAYSLSAEIYWNLKDWAEAEKAWLSAAAAAKNSYLEPISLFNAAVAAEEQGNVESALAHYNRVTALDFPGAARAQFSIGRLEESRHNTGAALEAYRNLLGRWPEDPLWTNLAQSRIIVLSD